MWASRVVSLGYRWKVGDGGSIKFWEDIWVGNSPLAMWDGNQIRGTFRRTLSKEMMVQWQEILEIARTITFSKEGDQLI
jgi:hypothetical protein